MKHLPRPPIVGTKEPEEEHFPNNRNNRQGNEQVTYNVKRNNILLTI